MLYAPRILKAPPGWRLSHFSRSDLPAMFDTSMSGVTLAMSRIRARASRIRSSVTNAAGFLGDEALTDITDAADCTTGHARASAFDLSGIRLDGAGTGAVRANRGLVR